MISGAGLKLVLAAVGVTGLQAEAMACPIPPVPISAGDLFDAPSDMVAVKAEITSLTWLGPHRGTPSSGFKLALRVVEVVSGSPGDTLVVEYGPCVHAPGQIGEIVPVLAHHRSDGRYVAPQFPPRMWPSRKHSDFK